MKAGFQKGGYGLVAGGPRLRSMVFSCSIIHGQKTAGSIRPKATTMPRTTELFFFALFHLF
jgi:hypothetical protein